MKIEMFDYSNDDCTNAFGLQLIGDEFVGEDIKEICNLLQLDILQTEYFFDDIENVNLLIECAVDLSYCQFVMWHREEGSLLADDVGVDEFFKIIKQMVKED